jgi:hypothetical protein
MFRRRKVLESRPESACVTFKALLCGGPDGVFGVCYGAPEWFLGVVRDASHTPASNISWDLIWLPYKSW